MANIHELTLGDVARENARRFRKRTAFIGEDGRQVTYEELDVRVTKAANSLRAAGLGPGSRILWLGVNSSDIFELLLASSKIGACLCVGNWRNAVDELTYVLDDFSPSLVVWQDADIGEKVAKARAATSSEPVWVRHDNGEYEQFISTGSADDDEMAVSSSAPCAAIYTAAFEGEPRAALLSSDNLMAMATTTILVREITSDDRCLVTAPAFHVMYLAEALPIFLVGGMNVFVRRIDASEIVRLVEQHRCTRAYLVTMTRDQIVEHVREVGGDLSSLLSSGTEDWEALVAPDPTPFGRFGGVYGQTEVSGIACYAAYGYPSDGVSGRPGPYAAIRIWDDEDRELPVGAVGEIVVKGPMVMAGYHGRDDENARMRETGWRRTNDLGRREEDGSISFVAPKTRIVKSGVENIYPVEVERCIVSLPGVADCAIIGVPDAAFIQSVRAIVVLEEGAQVTADAVIQHCVDNMASYKKPRSVEFVPDLPRAGGAVDYDELDRRFGGGNYPGGKTRTT
jgi:long-chain acyl-CoA synthetase